MSCSSNVKCLLLKRDWLLAQIKKEETDKNIMKALEMEKSWIYYFYYCSSFVDNS